MKQFFSRFQHISKLYVIAGACFVIGGIGLIGIFLYQPAETIQQATDALDTDEGALDPMACRYVRVLDGVCVKSERLTDPRLIAIMIENHYDARPLSGLSQASVVYEAPVEGNYNRFMALFPEDATIEKVGPVRSARPYYLDWLSEYDEALYMHVGGSPQALDNLVQYELFDLNEFYRGWYYWRDTARFAPHNVYTSSKLWNKALVDYGDTHVRSGDTPSFDSWTFSSEEPCTTDCTTSITITYAGPTYQTVWQYNTSTDMYERYELGKPVIDAETQTPITTNTLIVQYVDTTVLDDVGRLAMDTIGSGSVVVFRGGHQAHGTWHKAARTARTLFVAADNTPLTLAPGTIWISVINNKGSVVYDNDPELF